MPGDVKFDRAEIKNGGSKILLAQILYSSEFLDLAADG